MEMRLFAFWARNRSGTDEVEVARRPQISDILVEHCLLTIILPEALHLVSEFLIPKEGHELILNGFHLNKALDEPRLEVNENLARPKSEEGLDRVEGKSGPAFGVNEHEREIGSSALSNEFTNLGNG